MAKNKVLLNEKSASPKKEKKKFNKNISLRGIETKKSPKNRIKSIAAAPTPVKKKKREQSLTEWTVTESGKDTVVKRKRLVKTDPTENVDINASSVKIPKIKNKKLLKTSVSAKKEKKPIKSSNRKKQVVVTEKEKTEKENNLDSSIEIEPQQKFGIAASTTAKAIKAVIKLHRENPKLQNQLFDDPIEISLQVSCHKIPQGPSRIIRIPIPNSLLTPDDEICLIVPEVKGVKNIEHEQHIEHYENLLRNKGVENIKKIMTFHQFRTEYETFEQKSRLVDLYDMFLVDGKISGKVVKKCGKIFYKKRKVPTPVKLQASKLKEQIDKALSKAYFFMHLKGDSYSVRFGHDKMEIQDLVDNLFAVIEGLNKEFPGGFQNIKGLHVSTIRATSVPVYSSFVSPKEVVTPKITTKKPKFYKTYKGELTTLLDAEVVVKPTGEVLVKRNKMKKENEDNGNNIESNDEVVTKKSKKRKQAKIVQAEVGENDVETKEDKGITKTKKRKHTKIVNVELNENVEETLEASFSKNEIKKRKIQVNENVEVKTDENVTKKKKRGEKNRKELKPETKKKVKVVDGDKKEKKSKKVKNQP